MNPYNRQRFKNLNGSPIKKLIQNIYSLWSLPETSDDEVLDSFVVLNFSIMKKKSFTECKIEQQPQYMGSNRFFSAIISTFFLIFISNVSIAQIDTSVLYTRIPRDHQERIITDPKSHMKYVLDTAHIYIEEVTQDGERLWRTDPWKDSKWSYTLYDRPIVIRFQFKNDSSTHFRDILAINYDNLGGAVIDAKTGKLISIGQD